MKQLQIPYLTKLDETNIFVASSILKKHTGSHAIDQINWPDQFAHAPETRFHIARSKDTLWIHFMVTDEKVRAVTLIDQGEVWKDSCVEFFVKLPHQQGYANFEFNCLGVCLASRRTARNENIQPLSEQEMNSISRYSTLKFEPIVTESVNAWELTVSIPLNIISPVKFMAGDTLQANFYKCGDETFIPHYLSWNRIDSQQPDFHRPEYFGNLVM